jgi:hypothetical protein
MRSNGSNSAMSGSGIFLLQRLFLMIQIYGLSSWAIRGSAALISESPKPGSLKPRRKCATELAVKAAESGDHTTSDEFIKRLKMRYPSPKRGRIRKSNRD